MELKQKLYNKLTENGVRSDSVYSNVTGKGIQGRDKLQDVRPSSMNWSEVDLLEWYVGVPFLGRPVDRIAEEMYRESFTIETDNEGLNKAIEKRLTELDAYNKFVELERQSMIYRRGSVLFLACTSLDTINQIDLRTPLQNINKIESINIIPAFEISINQGNTDPTKANYYIPSLTIRGIEIDKSRFYWHVNKFIPKFGYGVSIVEQLIECGSALDIALWSLATMVYEAQIKVVKSNAKTEGTKFNIQSFISKLKSYINSQSVVLLGETESFDKQNLTITGLNDVTNYFWDTLGFISEVPANILKGQTKRVISLNNDPESISFYSKIEHKQEKANPYIKLVVDTILKEANINMPNYPYEIIWEKLYIIDDNTQADIDLKRSQTDTNYFNIQVKNSEDIQKERFPEIAEAQNESIQAANNA